MITNILFNRKRISLFKRRQLFYYSTNSTDIRVRFAPSPTGLLHLGGLRTALYNYLFAKSKNGVFILRIEDTDQLRLVPGAVEKLQMDLKWAGIIPDEGPTSIKQPYGPYIQSERLTIYKEEVEKLIKQKDAYLCFCTERRLNIVRREAIKLRQVPKYDNKCRHLTDEEINRKLKEGEKPCVRFKLSSGGQTYYDLVYGEVTHDVAAIEGDPVIFKSDGYPTYHLANVIDDHYMKISHVLRGIEWQPSTAKHLLLYKAFGWNPPAYGHLPLLVNPNGTKFSKRQGDVTVDSYIKDGIYPISLTNFVTFTGGFSRTEGESHEPRTFSIDELTNIFNLNYVNTHPCKLMFSQLPEFNRAEISRRISNESSLQSLIEDVRRIISNTLSNGVLNNDNSVSHDLQLDDAHISDVLKWSVNRIKRLKDLVEPNLLFLWACPSHEQLKGYKDINKYKDMIGNLTKELAKINKFEQNHILNVLKEFSKYHNLNFSNTMKTLRFCLSGLKEGPGVAEIMEILGKDCTCRRLERAVNYDQNDKTGQYNNINSSHITN